MKQADRLKATFALILGEKEIEAGQVTVRHMSRGEQIEVARSEVIAWLERNLECKV